MKTRRGFVSNSSSTSFTCELCRETLSGWDGDYGVDTYQCKCGHYVCEDCVVKLDELPHEKLVEMIQENWDMGDFDNEPTEEELTDYIRDNLDRWDAPECMCPFCAPEKIEAVTDADAYSYYLKKHKTSLPKLKEEIAKKFKNYKEFLENLNEK